MASSYLGGQLHPLHQLICTKLQNLKALFHSQPVVCSCHPSFRSSFQIQTVHKSFKTSGPAVAPIWRCAYQKIIQLSRLLLSRLWIKRCRDRLCLMFSYNGTWRVCGCWLADLLPQSPDPGSAALSLQLWPHGKHSRTLLFCSDADDDWTVCPSLNWLWRLTCK